MAVNNLMNPNRSREEWLSKLATSREPEDILKRYRMLMEQVYETLVALTFQDEADGITRELGLIEEYDSQISEYLYEERMTMVGRYDSERSTVILDHLPPDLQLHAHEGGFVIEHIPVWMVGHRSNMKLHPLYHRDRPFIRKRQLWHDLVSHLKRTFLATTTKIDWRDNGPIPDPLPPHSHMCVTFHSASSSDIRDLDNYASVISVLTNALVSNGLMVSDHPGRFALSIEWNRAETGVAPFVNIAVTWRWE